MAKTKFFRVAVEGATVDGRTIERAHIEQMAATYRPETYTARINIEHLRGYSPEPPFNAYGSVAEVKAEEIELEIGGKKEKRLALFASFDVNDQAKAINTKGQKLFSSVEIAPNFADSKKAYLVGLALTDSPASLGTEVIKFSSRDEKRKDNLIALSELDFEFEEEAAAADAVTGAFAAMKKFYENLTAPKQSQQPPAAANPPAPAENADFAAIAKAMGEGMDKLASAFATASAATDVRIAKVADDLAAFRKELEGAPSGQHKARPPATGGAGKMDMSAVF